jgi:UDPglucose 6-dehydrogenase
MNVCYVGGCGRLGLPFACWAAEMGHDVVIADIDEDAVARVNAGEFITIEPRVSELVAKHGGGKLKATTDTADAVARSGIIFIIVPTPSDESGRFSLDYVLAACDDIGPALSSGKTVVVSSTVMPGSVDGPIRQRLIERSGKVDFGLVYNPEFIRQGAIVDDYSNPDIVIIGGVSSYYREQVEMFLRTLVLNDAQFFQMSASSAEIAKIVLNSALVLKISLANQAGWLCQNVPGADATDALVAIGADSRIGSKYLRAGTWPGGPCLPRDCRALAAAGTEYNTPMPLMQAMSHYPEIQCAMLSGLISDFNPNCVGILGISYRPGVGIAEESQGLALSYWWGATQCVRHDPIIYPDRSLAWVVSMCDLLVLMTCHPEYRQLEDMDLSQHVVIDMWGFLEESKLNCKRYVRFGRCLS